jgi:hypothetical protein
MYLTPCSKQVRPAGRPPPDDHRLCSADTVSEEVYAAEKRLMAMAGEAVPEALANFLRDLNFTLVQQMQLYDEEIPELSGSEAFAQLDEDYRRKVLLCHLSSDWGDDAEERASKLEAFKQIDVVENKKVLLEKVAARCGISLDGKPVKARVAIKLVKHGVTVARVNAIGREDRSGDAPQQNHTGAGEPIADRAARGQRPPGGQSMDSKMMDRILQLSERMDARISLLETAGEADGLRGRVAGKASETVMEEQIDDSELVFQEYDPRTYAKYVEENGLALLDLKLRQFFLIHDSQHPQALLRNGAYKGLIALVSFVYDFEVDVPKVWESLDAQVEHLRDMTVVEKGYDLAKIRTALYPRDNSRDKYGIVVNGLLATQRKLEPTKRNGKGGGGRKTPVCYHCKEEGHIRPNCPKLKNAVGPTSK